MSFGQGYTPREAEKLAPGEYYAKILGTRMEQTKKGTPYLAVYLSIKDHPHARPNVLSFYDRPYVGQKEIERWDEKWTEFCDAFGLAREVPREIVRTLYQGHTGWVRCVPQKNAPEYCNLYPMVKRPEKASDQVPPPQPPREEHSGGGWEESQGEEFAEDIPF